VIKKQEINSMKDIKPAILLFIAFTILCGGVYPAIVTGIASVAFPKQAGGSFITDKAGKSVGSILIGQPFADPRYFWPRPSATTDFGYNPMASGGSNLGPTNPDFIKQVGERVKALRDSGISGNIPAELVLSSASGLDPDISPEAAKVQITRVAMARKMSEEKVQKLVSAHTGERQLGFLGEPRVNVLGLNLALDELR
jgi:K+-transporting ATPase ATPase C chain